MNEPKFKVLIPCAGTGSRFGGDVPKQYTLINGTSVLEHTLNAFLAVPVIDQIIIVVDMLDDYINNYTRLSPRIVIHKVGGTTRAESVLNGLNQLCCDPNDWILVHDAARCCITSQLVNNMIMQLRNDNVGGILAIPATDTVKIGINGIITQTLQRNLVYLAQTPQMFRYNVLRTALSTVDIDQITDEASGVEQLGLPVRLVAGDVSNLKITYSVDIQIAAKFLTAQQKLSCNTKVFK